MTAPRQREIGEEGWEALVIATRCSLGFVLQGGEPWLVTTECSVWMSRLINPARGWRENAGGIEERS